MELEALTMNDLKGLVGDQQIAIAQLTKTLSIRDARIAELEAKPQAADNGTSTTEIPTDSLAR